MTGFALTILLSGVALFLIANSLLAFRRGTFRRGAIVVAKAEEPALFWIEAVQSLGVAAAIGVSVWVYLRTGSFPARPLIGLVVFAGIAAVWLRDLGRGSATIGTAAFARAEEPREFWLLVALKAAFLLLIFLPFIH